MSVPSRCGGSPKRFPAIKQKAERSLLFGVERTRDGNDTEFGRETPGGRA